MIDKDLDELMYNYWEKFGDPVPTGLTSDDDDLKRLIIQAIETNEPILDERLIES